MARVRPPRRHGALECRAHHPYLGGTVSVNSFLLYIPYGRLHRDFPPESGKDCGAAAFTHDVVSVVPPGIVIDLQVALYHYF